MGRTSSRTKHLHQTKLLSFDSQRASDCARYIATEKALFSHRWKPIRSWFGSKSSTSSPSHQTVNVWALLSLLAPTRHKPNTTKKRQIVGFIRKGPIL